MMNTKPTYGNKNIDVLISGMAHLYHESIILPSVPTDIPSNQQGGGQPSDHSVVTARPMEDRINAPAKETIAKKTRRVDQGKLRKVGLWIQTESWEVVFDGGSATGMFKQFMESLKASLQSRKLS